MAWAVLQSAGASTYGTAVTATFTTANVTSGNKIVAVAASNWTDVPTVKDAALNTWTLVGSKVTTTGAVWLFALDVPAGDAGTKPALTATFAGAAAVGIVIQEVSGLLPGNTTAMCDGTAGTLSGTAAATGSPSYTSAASGEYLVCGYGDASGAVTIAPVSGWTLDAASQSPTDSDGSLEYKSSTGGSETGGFTGAYISGWAMVMVAFKLAAPSGTDTSPAWAASQGTLGGGAGSWTNPGNATGAANASWATWAAP